MPSIKLLHANPPSDHSNHPEPSRTIANHTNKHDNKLLKYYLLRYTVTNDTEWDPFHGHRDNLTDENLTKITSPFRNRRAIQWFLLWFLVEVTILACIYMFYSATNKAYLMPIIREANRCQAARVSPSETDEYALTESVVLRQMKARLLAKMFAKTYLHFPRLKAKVVLGDEGSVHGFRISKSDSKGSLKVGVTRKSLYGFHQPKSANRTERLMSQVKEINLDGAQDKGSSGRLTKILLWCHIGRIIVHVLNIAINSVWLYHFQEYHLIICRYQGVKVFNVACSVSILR